MGQGGPRHRVWLGHRSGEGNAGGRGGLRSRGRGRRGLQTLLSLGARLGGLCHLSTERAACRCGGLLAVGGGSGARQGSYEAST